MTLPVPDLDDRTFNQLVDEARRRAAATCPEWTDLSVHDPGVTLLEVFAFLTETMIYRLNRLPEKAYIAFLNLLGVRVDPPSAASVVLEFRRARPGSDAVSIPAGTRVTVGAGTGDAGPPPAFATTESAALAAGADAVRVPAHHIEMVEAEVLGTSSGLPGQTWAVARPPIVRTGAGIDVVLGVEVLPGADLEGRAARRAGDRTFELWSPVGSFAQTAPGDRVFVLDRRTGQVTFAPAVERRPDAGGASAAAVAGPVPVARAVAAVPPAGRQVCIWYPTGGGIGGNVAPGTLTALQSPLPLTVTNPEAARGGRAAESLENALQRGPQELFTLRRAVTAGDFELLACRSSGAVARARALTRAEMWSFAKPGDVELVVVPDVPESRRPGGRVTEAVLREHQTDEALARVQAQLDQRRGLGTGLVTGYGDYKSVAVTGTVVVRPEEDLDAVARRITERLYETINPLPAGGLEGWPFGQPLRASNVYRLIEQSEPAVQFVEDLAFTVEDAPDGAVSVVAADQYQPACWFAASGPTLFRSTNDGAGWEPVGRFPGEQIVAVRPYPNVDRPGVVPRPGLVAVATRQDGGDGSVVRLTGDLGRTWSEFQRFDRRTTDLAWTNRDQLPVLVMSTDGGLYERPLLPDGAGSAPPVGTTPLTPAADRSGVQAGSAALLTVKADEPDLGFYGVVGFTSPSGAPCLAAAAQAQGGVFLSIDGGPWRSLGLADVDTRSLAVQFAGPTTTLWVAVGEADPAQPGTGAYRARMFETDVRWEALSAGWTGGTCWAVRFAGTTAFAASQSSGVLRLDTEATSPTWRPVDINNGLPLRDRPRFEPVTTLATSRRDGLVLAGGPKGVHRSTDRAVTFRPVAQRTVKDRVTLPDTWLFCSGEHDIKVVRRDAPTED